MSFKNVSVTAHIQLNTCNWYFKYSKYFKLLKYSLLYNISRHLNRNTLFVKVIKALNDYEDKTLGSAELPRQRFGSYYNPFRYQVTESYT